MNFSSCSDHSWIKTTAIFSYLTFEFEYFFLCGLLSLHHKTLVLRYSYFFHFCLLVIFISWKLCCLYYPLNFNQSFEVFFLCSLLIVVPMHQRYLEFRRVLFLLLFFTHTVCLHHLWDVQTYAKSYVFLFSNPCVEVNFLSTVTYRPSTWAVNQETGASGRRYRYITLTCGRGWIRCRCVRPQEAGGRQTII